MSLWLGLLNWDISNDEDEEAINVFYIEEWSGEELINVLPCSIAFW